MRCLIALLLLAGPVHAWEFTARPVCTLSHSEGDTRMKVTYDHAAALYAIAVTTAAGWPDAPAFSIRFEGPRPNVISTRRHVVAGNTLTVTDSGFGNLLDGLEFNQTATAFTESAAAAVSLNGAAEPVQAFRGCVTTPVV